MALLFLVTKKQSVSNTIMSGLYGFGWGVILCAGVDSYFWLKFPMLPEYVGFLFNVVYGNSSAWGEEPWYAYFVRHLPNITNNPAVLVLFPVGLFSSGTGGPVQILGLAATVYVGLYSCLAHKEWRFVIYILPILNLVAASGAASLQTAIRHQTDGAKKKVTFAENNDDDIDSQVKSSNKPTTSQRKSAAAGDDVDPAGEAFLRQVRRFSYTAILAAVVLSSLGGFAVSTVKLAASTHNYPGGNALAAFHKFVDLDATREPVVVHLDVTTCMTGASRFGQLYDETSTHVPRVIYDKTEDYNKLLEVWPTFDYVIGIATPDRLPSVDGFKWHKIHSEPQFSRINLAYVRDLLSPANLISQVKALSGKSAVEELVKSVWSNVFITEEAVYIYKKVPAAV
jgi:alpha-1,6-mannosyltransferase